MSEQELLCPYRAVPLYPRREYDVDAPLPAITGEFGPCLKEKCAMWRAVDVHMEFGNRDSVETVSSYGHCGLAGKP